MYDSFDNTYQVSSRKFNKQWLEIFIFSWDLQEDHYFKDFYRMVR